MFAAFANDSLQHPSGLKSVASRCKSVAAGPESNQQHDRCDKASSKEEEFADEGLHSNGTQRIAAKTLNTTNTKPRKHLLLLLLKLLADRSLAGSLLQHSSCFLLADCCSLLLACCCSVAVPTCWLLLAAGSQNKQGPYVWLLRLR